MEHEAAFKLTLIVRIVERVGVKSCILTDLNRFEVDLKCI